MQKQSTEDELNNCRELDYITTCTIENEEPNKCKSIIVLKDVQVESNILENLMKLFTSSCSVILHQKYLQNYCPCVCFILLPDSIFNVFCDLIY